MSRWSKYATVLFFVSVTWTSDGLGQTGTSGDVVETGVNKFFCPTDEDSKEKDSKDKITRGILLTIDFDAKTKKMQVHTRDQAGNLEPTTTPKLELQRVTEIFDDRIVSTLKGVHIYTVNRFTGILRIEERVGDHWYSYFLAKPCTEFKLPGDLKDRKIIPLKKSADPKSPSS